MISYNKLLLLIVLFFLLHTSYSQGIKGKIIDEQGNPIAHATIYSYQTKNGTTSNQIGEYSLKLANGKDIISIRFLGLKPQEAEILVNNNWINKNFVLKTQNFEIKEIIVTNKSEDPAYLIMRRAIGMANFYKNIVQKYTAKVYLKGGAEVKAIPKILKKQIPIDTGKLHILETLSEITFELPNKISETVISMRSSEEDMTENPMRYANINIYSIETLGVISPLNPNAFSYYKFELLGSYKEFDRTINKIKFTPKRKGQDLVSGTLHISEDFWNINNSEITFQTPVGEAIIKEIYNPVQEFIWMPITKTISFNGGLMGVKFEFNYVASINNYKIELNPNINHSYLEQIAKINNYTTKNNAKKISLNTPQEKVIKKESKEIEELLTKENLSDKDMSRIYKKIEKENKKDIKEKPLEIKDNIKILPSAKSQSQEFWDSVTTVPLTKKEKLSYLIRDSLVEAHSKPEYLDSIKKAKQKFTFNSAIFGKTFLYKNDSTSLHFSGLLNPIDGIWFNCVDGFVYSNNISFNKDYKNSNYINFKISPAYAIARKAFMISYYLTYRYNPIKRSYLFLEAGTKSKDYSPFGANKTINTFASLWFKENYSRLFNEDFFSIKHKTDLFNGFEFTLGVKYSNRKALENNTNYSFTNRDLDYNANAIEAPEATLFSKQNNSAFTIETNIEYTPRYRFRFRKGQKIMVSSKYPTFFGSAELAIPDILNTNNNYLKAVVGIKQSVGLGFLSSLTYKAQFGTFIYDNKVGFSDYFHIPSSLSPVNFKTEFNSFALLPYYNNSHTNSYFNAKAEYSCNRFLIKRLPIINNTLISENFGINYYTTKGLKNYMEFSYGLHNIFMIINADLFVGFDNFSYSGVGFRLGIPIL